ncbi:hypothetical protein FN846DRAFT_892125 [Sphaerosporella brunnea]|uniref:Uncharacterized protein n=1 Tax=Sphaerosporella brunnea TaxID=1250544 RepID=A0A5J5EQA0_9PEZI|nr:hypothetical protein FN846DRAFT_892125 [Sphaerosporella brunnea]
MFSTSLSSSKRDQRPQSQQTSSSSPAPSIFSKRPRTSLPKLSPSLSCPHLPLLIPGKPSPPAITSTSAIGATTPTAEIFWGPSSSKASKLTEEGATASGATPHSRRLSMSGFPWDARSSSGRMSPAAELTGSIARRTRPVTPPAQLIHARNDGSVGFKDKFSPKSSLRLELPAPRLDADLGAHRRHTDPNTCSRHRGFIGQPLLGLAYPTTPDIGVHSSPVVCGACKDGAPGHHSGQGGGGGGGGSGGGMVGGAAARHLLLAAGPHGRGGLALLTPPDDNGILDWQQDGMQRIQADPETAVRMMGNLRGLSSSQSGVSVPAEQVKVNPGNSNERPAAALNGGLSSSPSSVEDSSSQPGKAVEEEVDASANREWIENAMEKLGGVNLPQLLELH